MKGKMVSTLALCAWISGASALAQEVNLTGTWKLNLAKSFLGADHQSAGYELTKTIAQKNGVVSITDATRNATVVNIPLPDSQITTEIAVDGKEHQVKLATGFPGMPSTIGTAVANWQGCTLEIRQLGTGFLGSKKQRLYLSKDGAELIVLVETHSTFADSERRLVFDKQ
jgi:hypothetical protein